MQQQQQRIDQSLADINHRRTKHCRHALASCNGYARGPKGTCDTAGCLLSVEWIFKICQKGSYLHRCHGGNIMPT